MSVVGVLLSDPRSVRADLLPSIPPPPPPGHPDDEEEDDMDGEGQDEQHATSSTSPTPIDGAQSESVNACEPAEPPPKFVSALRYGSLALPLSHDDLDYLFGVEVQMRQRLDTSPVTPPSPTHDYAIQIQVITSLLQQGVGSEDEWLHIVQMQDYALIHALIMIMAYIPLPHSLFHPLLSCLRLLSTLLPPSKFHSIFLMHAPHSVDKVLCAVDGTLADDDIRIRLQVLDMVLIDIHPDEKLPATSVCISDSMQELFDLLAHPKKSISALAATNLLLLNQFDTARPLLPMVVSKQQELLTSPVASPPPTSPTSPLHPITTHTLSSFSQEVVALINQGRLAPSWQEEEEVYVRREQDPRRIEMEDMYAGQRTQVQALPDRLHSRPILTAALSFVEELFHANLALEFFYTNDISVLIDVLIRKLGDQQEDVQETLDLLLGLSSIISWPDYALPSYQYRVDAIDYVLSILIDSISTHTREVDPDALETMEANKELAESIRNKIRKMQT